MSPLLRAIPREMKRYIYGNDIPERVRIYERSEVKLLRSLHILAVKKLRETTIKESPIKSSRALVEGFFRQARKSARSRSIATSRAL